MTQYKLTNEANMDLVRIYWRGVEEFGEVQAERYYEAFFSRFDEIAESPFKYQASIHMGIDSAIKIRPAIHLPEIAYVSTWASRRHPN